jgi:hypothetical protein
MTLPMFFRWQSMRRDVEEKIHPEDVDRSFLPERV